MGRAGSSEAAGTLYAIASESTYLRAGLSPDVYARWLTDTLSAARLNDR